MTQHIALIAFDHCHASGLTGALDLLHMANAVTLRLHPGTPPPFVAQVYSPDGAPVRAANGYHLAVDGALGEARAGVIVVPGIALHEPAALLQAVQHLRPVGAWLAQRHAEGAYLAAACSAAFVLAEAGLLDAHRATTTTWYAELFAQRYPKVRLSAGDVLVESGRLLTSGGAFSYIDLVLHLIERFAGRELARVLARYVVLDNRRDARTMAVIPQRAHHDDPVILKAEQWMRAHLRSDIGVRDIADHVAVSGRTLVRRFKERTGESPSAYLQRLRLDRAKALLAGSHHRIEQIPGRVGYQDESAFRRLFKKHVGVSPREYRRQFAAR